MKGGRPPAHKYLNTETSDTFRTNVRILLAVNFVTVNEFGAKHGVNVRAVPRWIEKPNNHFVKLACEFFQELEEDMLEHDYRKDSVGTLMKPHLQKYWLKRINGE